MVNYDNLPVYKTSYDLLLSVFEIVKHFERDYKYTLGESIKKELLELISSVYRANSSFEARVIHIKKSRETVEVLRLYIRLSKDLKLIVLDKFVRLSDGIESLSKQLLAWENSIKK